MNNGPRIVKVQMITHRRPLKVIFYFRFRMISVEINGYKVHPKQILDWRIHSRMPCARKEVVFNGEAHRPQMVAAA
jgi:hypothetical protein